MKKIALILSFVGFGLVAGATDLPNVVEQALEPFGGTKHIENIERFEEDGKTYYEITLADGHRDMEILVDENGKVLEAYSIHEDASGGDW